MIIPEHEQRMINDEQGQSKDRKKPELDEQRLEEFGRIFAQSMEDHGPITVTVCDKRFDMEYRGIVMRVDQET